MDAPILDINVDERLKQLSTKEGVKGYVVFNNDGIPLKYHTDITYEKSVHFSSLFSELWNVSRKIIQRELKSPENVLETIRLRTKLGTELLVSQIGNYTLVCIQNCNKTTKEEKVLVVAAVDAGAKVDAGK